MLSRAIRCYSTSPASYLAVGETTPRFVSTPLIKPVLTRQLGLHKWSAAEDYVRTRFATKPGLYIISRAAGCTFCIDVSETRKISHQILRDEPVDYVADLTIPPELVAGNTAV